MKRHRHRPHILLDYCWIFSGILSGLVESKGCVGRGRDWRKGGAFVFGAEQMAAFVAAVEQGATIVAAAEAAGICVNSVYRARASDAAFAEGFEEALGIGYALLEAEALRRQRAEQEAYKIDPKADPGALALSFERTMQLLREYHRGHGRIGRRPTDARLTKWSFEAAFGALEKRLEVFGLRIEAGEGPPGEHCD